MIGTKRVAGALSGRKSPINFAFRIAIAFTVLTMLHTQN